MFQLTLNIFLQLFMTYRHICMKLSSRVTPKISEIRGIYAFQGGIRLKWAKFCTKFWVHDHRKTSMSNDQSKLLHSLDKCFNWLWTFSCNFLWPIDIFAWSCHLGWRQKNRQNYGAFQAGIRLERAKFCSKFWVNDHRKKSMSNNQPKLFSFVR